MTLRELIKGRRVSVAPLKKGPQQVWYGTVFDISPTRQFLTLGIEPDKGQGVERVYVAEYRVTFLQEDKSNG